MGDVGVPPQTRPVRTRSERGTPNVAHDNPGPSPVVGAALNWCWGVGQSVVVWLPDVTVPYFLRWTVLVTPAIENEKDSSSLA